MPIFALLFGIMLVEVGVRDNAKPLFSQLASDAQGFLAFGAAIMILAILGSIDSIRPITKALLVLLFVVFLLKNGNAVVKGLTASASAKAVDTNATAATPSASSNSNSADALKAFSEIAPYLAELG